MCIRKARGQRTTSSVQYRLGILSFEFIEGVIVGVPGGVDRVSVLRIMEPLEGAIINVPRKGKTASFNITWAMIGSGMDGPFDIYLNNTVVKRNIMNVRTTTVNTKELEEKGLILKPGSLNVTVVASRGWTRFGLSKVMVDRMMPEPQSTASAFRVVQLNIV